MIAAVSFRFIASFDGVNHGQQAQAACRCAFRPIVHEGRICNHGSQLYDAPGDPWAALPPPPDAASFSERRNRRPRLASRPDASDLGDGPALLA
jgi:hypothetical protein